MADAAGALAPYLPPGQAAPAVLKLLGVVLQDSHPQVRCQALASLAQLVAALGTDVSASAEVLPLLLAAAGDGSSDVCQLLLQTALPAVLAWVRDSDALVTQLLPLVSRRCIASQVLHCCPRCCIV